MTDIPFRVYGPAPLNGGLGSTLYTAPSGTSKFFIRDLTFSNIGTSAITSKVSIGDITSNSNLVVNQSVAANSTASIRPLWLIDAAETLQGLQTLTSVPTLALATGAQIISGTDSTSKIIPAWTPAANTMYILTAVNGVASGTTALNPSSITGNGTWTLINQTTSTIASDTNVGVAAYWWYSTSAGSSATTTVNWASTQHSGACSIFSVANAYPGTAAVSPWTSAATPIVQSAVAADTTLPGSTNQTKIVTLSALQTGMVFYLTGRCETGAGVTTTEPTGFTEPTSADWQLDDGVGTAADLAGNLTYVTSPPWTSTTVGPGTFLFARDDSRASIAWEMIPSGFVNCMVSGIEVK
jgi:hypothetical protein